MTFLIVCALVAIAFVAVDAWHANRVIERARAEFGSDRD